MTLPTSDTAPRSEADLNLLHRYLLGELEAEELRHLEHDMMTSPATRARFLGAVRLDVALHDQALGLQDEGPARIIAIPWRQLAGMAAALGLGALGWWKWLPANSPPAVADHAAVATIAAVADSRACQWAGAGTMAVAERLAPGMLELDAGVALIEFDGGARLALQGPARLELIGPKTARLHRGSASVRCEKGVYSFSLLTPTSTVIDLGTEFGVAVDGNGASEVHVLDGEVEVADAMNGPQQTTRFLNAGDTLLLSSNGANRLVKQSSTAWVRDYTTSADREAKSVAPRVIARDAFPAVPAAEMPFSQGTGWAGAWWLATKGKKDAYRLVPLEPLAKRDGVPGAAMQVGGWVEVRRRLADAIDPTRPQTVYLGFSLQRANPNHRGGAGKLSEATVLFRSSKDPTVVFGMALSGKNHWVVLEPGGWERSELPAPGSGPYFVVAKVEFNPWQGNRVSMIGFELTASLPAQEPDHWDLVSQRQLAKTTVPLDVIALQVRQTPFKFGEITLGNSWQAVVNPSSAGK